METKKRSLDEIIELIVVILLGVTALLTAWGSWIGSLHGGVQATSYTQSNNLASEGNSEYNAGVQQMNQDMLLWNDISDMQLDISFNLENGDEYAATKTCYQLYYKLNENLTERMSDAIGWSALTEEELSDPESAVYTWLEMDEAYTSPFFDEEYVAGYFDTANELLTASAEQLEIGKAANANGDAFGLVTVIYSVVLFLLGIVGTFKKTSNKYALIGISAVAFIFATVYMVTIPMPLDFSFLSFFGA